jgi:hypothetical protein
MLLLLLMQLPRVAAAARRRCAPLFAVAVAPTFSFVAASLCLSLLQPLGVIATTLTAILLPLLLSLLLPFGAAARSRFCSAYHGFRRSAPLPLLPLLLAAVDPSSVVAVDSVAVWCSCCCRCRSTDHGFCHSELLPLFPLLSILHPSMLSTLLPSGAVSVVAI